MTLEPVHALAPARPVSAAVRPHVATPADGTGFVTHGDSGLLIQSYGAVAFISAAALARLAASRQPPAVHAAIPAVEPVGPVVRAPRIDVLA